MSSSSPAPLSPQRNRRGGDHSNSGKEERPRFFDNMAKKLCWAKADIVPGRHPERWRKDAAGNIVCKRFCNCQGCLCFEYDHIVPFSKGGESVAENCQILQTRVNRVKSDKDHIDKTQLRGYSCDINFTDGSKSISQATASQVESRNKEGETVIDIDSENVNDLVNEQSVCKEKKGSVGMSLSVWDHFTNIKSATEVQCSNCKKVMACNSRKNGTSALSDHLNNACKTSPFYKKRYI